MKATRRSRSERSVYICQIDTYFAVKDYQRKGRCLRLIGISESDFLNADFERTGDGVKTFTFDLSYWTYCREVLGKNTWLTTNATRVIDSKEGTIQDRLKWYRLEIVWGSRKRDGYGYATFSDSPPRYFEMKSCSPGAMQRDLPPLGDPLVSFVLGGPVGPSTKPRAAGSLVDADPFSFHAFHVGQAMCSLVKNSKRGFLLDAGAGTPVTRPRYLKGSIKNELTAEWSTLDSLDLILSHADVDHWRLLSWDKELLKAINRVYVPKDAKSIAWHDSVLIKKIQPIGDMIFPLSSHDSIRVWRSKPKKSDDNGECLVIEYISVSGSALVPGDYVYSRFATDGCQGLRKLRSKRYDAVIVPHHGDAHSSELIVRPRSKESMAFFSAGNHKKFNHPTALSREKHQKAGFVEICDNLQKDIIKKTLL